jgi:hypothetical protein
MAEYVKVRLEDIQIGTEQQELVLLRERGEEKRDRVRVGLNGADGVWFLFCALRDRILEQGAEIERLRARLDAKPAKSARGKAA